MKNYQTSEIKNVVLLGASGSGKTTFAEAMAYEGKVIDRRGTIENGTTLSDNTDLERTNQRSIYSTILYTEFMNHKLNIIDAPGSDDFSGGLFSAFKVADVGLMLFNAQNGFEVGSEIQSRYAETYKVPLIGVINQLDHEKANWENTMESIAAFSKVKPVIVQYPVNPGPHFDAFIDVLLMKMFRFKDENGTREELPIPAEEAERAAELHHALLEAAAENDEGLMDLYFEKGDLETNDIRKGLGMGIANRDWMPIFCASAKRDIGTKRVMEFVINVAPNPDQRPPLLDVEGEPVLADASAPTVLFVFKSTIEQHVGEISYFRVVRGKVTEGMELIETPAPTTRRRSRSSSPWPARAVRKVSEMVAGDIGCTVKLKSTRTGDHARRSGHPCGHLADDLSPNRATAPPYAPSTRPTRRSWANCSTRPNTKTPPCWSNTPRS